MSNLNLSKTFGLFFVLPAVCLLARPAEAKYGGGTGEPNDPYLIYTAEQMSAIGADPNDWDKHFKLVADIDFVGYTGTDFNIIGYWRSWGDNKPFTGVFDGNGKNISNFTCTSADTDYIGLFGCVKGEYAEVKDLGLIEPNVDAGTAEYVGSLVAYLIDATISGCYAEGGSVSGRCPVGGLVGENKGTIINCNSSGSVSGDDGIGGLVGHNTYNGRITNCYSSGDVSGMWSVGGLVGESREGTIADCHAIGSVTGDGYVGGLVGQNYGISTITNCYSAGSVIGNNAVGGLVGENYGDGTITNCYSTGSVSGAGSVGGLVGNNYARISGCYATGSVSGSYDVGGLVGAIGWYGTITNCYSTSGVFGESKVGGLIGSKSEYGTPTVMDSFWDIQTSGQSTSAGGTGKTTAEMQTESTFTDAGWDFVAESVNGTEDIWSICEGTNYPRLTWQIPAGDFVCPDGITIADLLFFIEHWGEENCDLGNDYCQGTDLDQSGTVDASDLEIFVENWLADIE